MAYPRLAKQIIDLLASRLLAANRRIVERSGTKEAETNIVSDSSKT